MNSPRQTIAIAGAGIAGLTAALFLERAGFRVVVFEKLAAASTSGTGIQLSPNAFKVLDQLSLGELLIKAGTAPESVKIASGISGKPLASFALGNAIRERHGAPYLVLQRSDLAAILLGACVDRPDIEIHFRQEVVGCSPRSNGVALEIGDALGVQKHSAGAVIGADGVWSKLRNSVTGAAQPSFTGRIAWRAVASMDQVSEAFSRTSTGLWLGPEAHVVHYPISGGTKMNVIAITPWKGDAMPEKGWIESGNMEHRTSTFEHWTNGVRELVSQEFKWGGWPIHAVGTIGKFADGALCLIGDSAHPMVPYGAQGGACAIEDACVLANCCAERPENLPVAFQQFETLRSQRVQRVIKLSENNRKLYHLGGAMAAFRNATMGLPPQTLLQKRMDWLYGWES